MRDGSLVASLLVFAALTTPLAAQPAALEEAVKLMREGRFDQALVRLDEARRNAPRSSIIENLMGISETKLGHIYEADNYYRNAIQLDPLLAPPHRNLGFNLLNARDFPHAEPELREAARLEPSDRFVHDYLMLLALATGRDSEALREASLAGNLVDGDPEAGAGLAEVEIRLGQVDAATDSIERLEDSGKLSAPREFAMAALLSQRGFQDEAVHCFRRIAALEPSWESRYNLAIALLYDKKSPEAAALLSVLHEERPTHADTLMFLGSAFESQQEIPEALKAYRAALTADPSNPDRTLDYTRLLMDMDRYDEAIQVVHMDLAQTSASAPLQLRLGAVEMVKGNYVAARGAFHAALAADPQLDAGYVGLAETYARQANDAEALRVLQEARQQLPGHYLPEYYFGLVASRLGREQEAIGALQKAADLEPMSADPLYELGKLYAGRQNWSQARLALEKVIALNPQYAPAHYQLGKVYAHLGFSAKAAQEAERTQTLVDMQRDQALSQQRERAASFQPVRTAIPLP